MTDQTEPEPQTSEWWDKYGDDPTVISRQQHILEVETRAQALRIERDAKRLVANEEMEALRGPRTKRTGREFSELPPVPTIMRDILAAEINLLGGPSAAGKSLLARDWSLSVATGTPWMGYEVPDARKVLWIASEGLNDFTDRWTSQPLWDAAQDSVFILGEPINLVSGDDTDWLLKEYGDERPGLVVFDLIYGMGMADDNGMKDALPVLTNLKKISREWGAATLPLGHSGHNGDRRFRGTSAWRQQSETEWHMADNVLDCRKSKITDYTQHRFAYENTYPDIDWLTAGGAAGVSSRKHQQIKDYHDAHPGESQRHMARVLTSVVGYSETYIRDVLREHRKEQKELLGG